MDPVREETAASGPGAGRRDSRLRRRAAVAAKVLVGLFLLWLVLRKVRLGESIELIREARPMLLAAALALTAAANLLSVARWKILLAAAGARIGFWRLFLVNLVGIFFSTFLPGSIGGDVFKVFYLANPRESAPLLSATVVSRILGMVAVFGTGLAVAPLAGAALHAQPWWPLYLALLLAGLFGSVMPLFPGLDRLGLSLLRRLKFPARLVRLAASMLEPIANWRGRPGAAAASMVLALLFQFLGPFLTLYCCALALGARVAPADVAAIAVVASVAFALPISLNGIGVAEGVYVVLFGLLGVSPERAFLIALLFRLVVTTQAVAGGLAYFVVKRKPIGTAPQP
jgi:uncharacterized membrane protein YbhN (UPF0104 family)